VDSESVIKEIPMFNFLFAILFAFGGLQPAYLDHGSLYVNHTVIASGMNSPVDCAIYRLGVELGTLAGDVLEECP
jgi:hypothetical protein